MKPPYKAIDPGIRKAVKILFENGIETFESCEGGAGHAFFEPTIRFHGSHGTGLRAVSIAMQYGLRVNELRRYYTVLDGELVGPSWELTFWGC
jgi:hypothetical protein